LQCADTHKGADEIRLGLFFDKFRFGAKQHDNVSDAGDQVAVRFFGEFRSQSFLFFFEIVELDLEQFGMGKRLIQGGEERGTEAFLADLERRFEPLRAGFQVANPGIGQSFHGQKFNAVVTEREEKRGQGISLCWIFSFKLYNGAIKT